MPKTAPLIYATGMEMQLKHSRSRSCAIVTVLALLLFAAPGSRAVELVDAEGLSFRFTQPFKRIISLYPAHTENLIHLGVTEQLIGVSTGDTYPAQVRQKNLYSYRDNIEKFLSAAPDLILIRPMISRSQPELINQLRKAGITIISLQPTSAEDMYAYWLQLGQLSGTEVAAKRMVKSFQAAVDTIKTRVPENPDQRPKVYFEAIHTKMKTFSPTAIAIFCLETAGGINIAGDAVPRNSSNIAPYGKERILALAPDIDIFLSQVGRMNRVTLADLFNEPGFKLISAVQKKAVFLIEEEIVSRPTMRLLQGIEKIQARLYPTDNSAHKIAQNNK